jgi:hypothetical protein
MSINLALEKCWALMVRIPSPNAGVILAVVLAIAWPALPAFLFAPDNQFSQALDWLVHGWSKATGLSGIFTSGMTVSGYLDEHGPARFYGLLLLCVAHFALQFSYTIWTIAKRRADFGFSFGYLLLAAVLFAYVIGKILFPDIRHGEIFPSLHSYWFLPDWALGGLLFAFYACAALKAGLLRDPK